MKNLEWIDRVKSMQAGWIGFQKGYNVLMEISNIDQNKLRNLLSS